MRVVELIWVERERTDQHDLMDSRAILMTLAVRRDQSLEACCTGQGGSEREFDGSPRSNS